MIVTHLETVVTCLNAIVTHLKGIAMCFEMVVKWLDAAFCCESSHINLGIIRSIEL
jgi:hypothetical protein